MSESKISRREFLREGAAAAAGIAAVGASSIVLAGNPTGQDTSKILNYNPEMEYRRCGKTGLMLSAIALGGHWKRLNKVIGGSESQGWMTTEIDRADFQRNRYEVVSRAIERGINYVDACCGEEILAYARALRGRRDKMHFGFSWHVRESRFPQWRSAKKLLEGLDMGLKEAGLDHAELWRISLLTDSSRHTPAEVDEAAAALEQAKKSGRARFIGVSSHDQAHLKKIIEKYPAQVEVVLTPYTAKTKTIQDEAGLFAAIQKHDVGWLGIKPFASNSVFKGDSSPNSPYAEEDNRIARLTLRYILGNPAITAPMPGLITTAQVDNAALAVKERRELDVQEKAELDRAMDRAFANLPADYHWLKQWEYV